MGLHPKGRGSTLRAACGGSDGHRGLRLLFGRLVVIDQPYLSVTLPFAFDRPGDSRGDRLRNRHGHGLVVRVRIVRGVEDQKHVCRTGALEGHGARGRIERDAASADHSQPEVGSGLTAREHKGHPQALACGQSLVREDSKLAQLQAQPRTTGGPLLRRRVQDPQRYRRDLRFHVRAVADHRLDNVGRPQPIVVPIFILG